MRDRLFSWKNQSWRRLCVLQTSKRRPVYTCFLNVCNLWGSGLWSWIDATQVGKPPSWSSELGWAISHLGQARCDFFLYGTTIHPWYGICCSYLSGLPWEKYKDFSSLRTARDYLKSLLKVIETDTRKRTCSWRKVERVWILSCPSGLDGQSKFGLYISIIDGSVYQIWVIDCSNRQIQILTVRPI